MGLSLIVLAAGRQQGQVLEVKPPQFLVGRDPGCQLRPASPLIGQRHCVIRQREGRAFLRDLVGTNETFVNDQPVRGEVELCDGDRLRIGPLLFGVRLRAGTPVDRPAPLPPPKAAHATGVGAPVAPPQAAAGASGGEDEDSIAALLLSSEDEDRPDKPTPGGEVPGGSAGTDAEAAAATLDGQKPAGPSGKGSTAGAAGKDTSSAAAAALLQLYRKRPRG
jgi:predicted component of type VI protein secretion system